MDGNSEVFFNFEHNIVTYRVHQHTVHTFYTFFLEVILACLSIVMLLLRLIKKWHECVCCSHCVYWHNLLCLPVCEVYVLQRDGESTRYVPITLPQLFWYYFLLCDQTHTHTPLPTHSWSFSIIVWPAAPPLLSHFTEGGEGEVMRLSKDKRMKGDDPYICLCLQALCKDMLHLIWEHKELSPPLVAVVCFNEAHLC